VDVLVNRLGHQGLHELRLGRLPRSDTDITSGKETPKAVEQRIICVLLH
jgi:hypothetical protein